MAAFYEAAFGFAKTVDEPVYVELALPGGMRLGLYDRAGWTRLTGTEPTHPPPGGLSATELYLYDDDLEAAIERLEAAGARPLSALANRDWGDACAYFADPEGNVLVLARPLS